jgi:imidazolonepropionase-like amidohydrolase
MIRPLFVLLLLLVFGCKNQAHQTYDLAITNANVIHLDTGEVELQNIYISNGKIAAIETVDTKRNVKADSTIDATGKYVLPGFWDNHIHLRGGDSLIANNRNFLKLFMANGITTVRDAGGDLTTSVMEWKQQITDEKLMGPTIFTAGPKIDGPGARWGGSLEVATGTDIQQAFDSLEKLNVDFVKIYDSRIDADNYIRSIEEAKKRGFVVSGHMPFTVTLDETIDAGMDGIEHLYYIIKGCASNETEVTEKLKNGEMGFWDAMPALMGAYSDSTAQASFDSLKEKNVYVVPTLHIGKTLSYLDEVDHTKDPYLQYMGKGMIETYEGRIRSAMNASEEARKSRKELDTFFGQLAKSLDNAGVQLLAGSDSGAFNSYTYPGISLHMELQEMVKNGISPLNALKTSAYNGSQFLRQSDDYGTIAAGKISDLVLLNDNPLDNIENTQNIYMVIKGTQLFDHEKLQALLDEAIMD